MILTDRDILDRMGKGLIEISPFNRKQLGSNSYDLTLSDVLLVYTSPVLDAAQENPYTVFTIPPEGFVLQPGELYLGSTREFTRSMDTIPQLEGKSSIARLGISVHLTAGFGDIGFKGHWTLEIMVVKPVRIYADMPIAQIYYILASSQPEISYDQKEDAKYQQQTAIPVPSRMWKNFKQEPPQEDLVWYNVPVPPYWGGL